MSLNLLFSFIALSEGGKGGLLDVNPGLIIWTVVTFIFLLIVLTKLAWKPILKSLSERENLIRESLEKAEIAKKEAEKLIEENKANLDKAEEEAQKIIAQSREYAEKLKAQMLEESNAEAKKRIEEAKSEIERKNQEAFNQMKDQIASIAVEAAEKIIRENLDENKKKNLVKKYLEDLSKN
jgi:F-type H+-transporting ATPase subunit b